MSFSSLYNGLFIPQLLNQKPNSLAANCIADSKFLEVPAPSKGLTTNYSIHLPLYPFSQTLDYES